VEADSGNGYDPGWGMLLMMMMVVVVAETIANTHCIYARSDFRPEWV